MNDDKTAIAELEADKEILITALLLCQQQLRKLTFKDTGVTTALECTYAALAKTSRSN